MKLIASFLISIVWVLAIFTYIFIVPKEMYEEFGIKGAFIYFWITISIFFTPYFYFNYPFDNQKRKKIHPLLDDILNNDKATNRLRTAIQTKSDFIYEQDGVVYTISTTTK